MSGIATAALIKGFSELFVVKEFISDAKSLGKNTIKGKIEQRQEFIALGEKVNNILERAEKQNINALPEEWIDFQGLSNYLCGEFIKSVKSYLSASGEDRIAIEADIMLKAKLYAHAKSDKATENAQKTAKQLLNTLQSFYREKLPTSDLMLSGEIEQELIVTRNSLLIGISEAKTEIINAIRQNENSQTVELERPTEELESNIVLPENDPILVLVNQANHHLLAGKYNTAYKVAHDALYLAENSSEDDLKQYRVGLAKLSCISSMSCYVDKAQTIIDFISDILRSGVFSKSQHTQFILYLYWANSCLIQKDTITAKAILDKAQAMAKTSSDNLLCKQIEGEILLAAGKYLDAIDLQKRNYGQLQILLNETPPQQFDDRQMIGQNIGRTLHAIAQANKLYGDTLSAGHYYNKAVNAAREYSFTFDEIIYLLEWASLLTEENNLPEAITKTKAARELASTLHIDDQFFHASYMLCNLYYLDKDYSSARATLIDAFEAIDDTSRKNELAKQLAMISAELGDSVDLEKRLSYLSRDNTFSCDESRDDFEQFSQELRTVCDLAMLPDYIHSPWPILRVDNGNRSFKELREQLEQIIGGSENQEDADKKLLDWLLSINGDKERTTSEKKNTESGVLNRLLCELESTESLPLRAQLNYEIGCYYFKNGDLDRADLWYKRAINMRDAPIKTILWGKIGRAQVFMERRTINDENEARRIIDESITQIDQIEDVELLAFFKFIQARLEARNGNFQSAKWLFQQSKSYIAEKKEMLPSLRNLDNRIDNCLDSIQCNISVEKKPRMGLTSLLEEFFYLCTWYPQYTKDLTQYWWYYNKDDVINNIRLSGECAGLIYSSDKDTICWYSEALKFLFVHCLFADKEKWMELSHATIRTFPVPVNIPFPYSAMMIYDKEDDGKQFGYYVQSDGSETKYPYVRVADKPGRFDEKRNPPPMTLCYWGYQIPQTVLDVIPVIRNSKGSCRWWVGRQFGRSVNDLLNFSAECGLIPVVCYEDIQGDDDVVLVTMRQVIIPYDVHDKDIYSQHSIQQALKELAKSIDEKTCVTDLLELSTRIGELQVEKASIVEIHLGILMYKHYSWRESPAEERVYPVVILTPDDKTRNRQNNPQVAQQIAQADASVIMSRLAGYASYSHPMDLALVKQDLIDLQALAELSKDSELIESSDELLRSFSEFEKGTEEGVLLFDEPVLYVHQQEETDSLDLDALCKDDISESARNSLLDSIEIDENTYALSEDMVHCSQCGKVMLPIGKEIQEKLELDSNNAILRRNIFLSYSCDKCKQLTNSVSVKQVPEEPELLPNSCVSAKAVAHIAVQKYVMGTALSQQEQEWKSRGVNLSRMTMANWLLKCTEKWLVPIYDELHRQLIKQDLIQVAMTEVDTKHDVKDTAKARNYIWLFRTSPATGRPIVLYEYHFDCNQKPTTTFLQGFHGYLQTGKYTVFEKIEGVTHVGCWRYIWESFNNALGTTKKGKKSSTAVQGTAYCTQLLEIEEKLISLSPEERKAKRIELEKPVLDEVFSWASKRTASPKTKLGITLNRLKNDWSALTAYLQDGRIELTNKWAENSIVPFVISQGIFQFSSFASNYTSEVQACAVLFSLIITSIENRLDPYHYLSWVLSEAPKRSLFDPNWAKSLTPQNAPGEQT